MIVQTVCGGESRIGQIPVDEVQFPAKLITVLKRMKVQCEMCERVEGIEWS